jgi:L-ribulose-5-phosphate 4-epimerase
MLEKLKEQVCNANLTLFREGLVTHASGNASAVDRKRGALVIKPSGIPYDIMRPEHMVVVSLSCGAVTDGDQTPCEDTPAHIAIYRAFRKIGGIAHTRSLFASAWAQAGQNIPTFGTIHADRWHGEIPCTRFMTDREIAQDYEWNIGQVIVESFRGIDPLHRPTMLVAGHGPFTWGANVDAAVQNAVFLEFAAKLASETVRINPHAKPLQATLAEKRFQRSHDPRTRRNHDGWDIPNEDSQVSQMGEL